MQTDVRESGVEEAAAETPRAGLVADVPYVLDLRQVGIGDLPLVGGKGANLGELLRAGFAVPPGFAITTTAYDAVAAANGLSDTIARAADERDATALHAAFTHARIPEPVEHAIRDAYRRLGGGPVAVRSSATAEDLPTAAFAGQQETFLNVSGAEEVLAAVRNCWASLWTERAVLYRHRQGFGGAAVKLAVVVQPMVDADAAGVMFTANPITGARNETVVDANAGLGEAVVAGLVTPDHVVLRRQWRGWRIVTRQIGRRETEIRTLPGGGVAEVPSGNRHDPVLSDRALRNLADLGVAIARHFGAPQDVEWARSDGRIAVLQSRPITALPDPDEARSARRLRGFAPLDYFQVRPYPLDMTTWVPAFSGALSRMLPIPRAALPFTDLWREEDGVVTEFAGLPGMRPSPWLLLGLARMLALAARFDPGDWRHDPLLAEYRNRITALEAIDLSALPFDQLLAMIDAILPLPKAMMEVRRRYLPRALLSLGLLRLFLQAAGAGDRFATLLSGADNITLAGNRHLEALAATIRQDSLLRDLFARHDATELGSVLSRTASGRALLDRIEQFLAVYGRRETGSPLLVSPPTWMDDPAISLGVLKGLAAAAPPERTERPDWEMARDALLAQDQFQIRPLRAAFLAVLAAARRFPALREDTHFLLTMPLPVLRRTLLELGRRLTAIGVLSSPMEVFHLRLEELREAAASWPPAEDRVTALRATVARRAAKRAELANVPMMHLPSLPLPESALASGIPGAPGVAIGPVRIVRDVAEFGSLLPGDVLVAPYTNPSWTPLFVRAAAVIADTGSVVSHAAIVAREYGIPAVMGTGDATRRLRDGEVVVVDGTRGLVLPAGPVSGSPPPASPATGTTAEEASDARLAPASRLS